MNLLTTFLLLPVLSGCDSNTITDNSSPEVDAKIQCDCITNALSKIDEEATAAIRVCKNNKQLLKEKYAKKVDSRQRQRDLIDACLGELKVKESERLAQLFLRSEQGFQEHLDKDLKMISSYVSMLQLKSNKLPKTLDEVRTLSKKDIPKDPWGNDYHYAVNPSCKSGFEIISYGPDKKKGNDDISTCNN